MGRHRGNTGVCDAIVQTHLSLIGKRLTISDLDRDNKSILKKEIRNKRESKEEKHPNLERSVKFKNESRDVYDENFDVKLIEAGICKKFKVRLKRKEVDTTRLVTVADVNVMVPSTRRWSETDSAYGSGSSPVDLSDKL